jgi:hypothetical protein
LKKFKCLVGEDKFKEILSYNKVMQHIGFFVTTKSCNALRRLMMIRRPSRNTNGSLGTKAL